MKGLMESDSLQPTGTLLKLLERVTFVGIWTFDPAQNRIEWSDQLAAIHGAQPGYSPAPGEAFALYAPEWRERISDRVQACATRGVPFDEEMQILTLQGRRTWVRSIGDAVRNREGDIVRVQGAVQEITPHGHRAGTLLRHTVSMDGAMTGGDAFVTVDHKGRLSYVNDQAERLLGRPVAALLGRPSCGWKSSSGASFPPTRCWRWKNSMRTCRPGSRPGAIRSGRAWRCTCATSARVTSPMSSCGCWTAAS